MTDSPVAAPTAAPTPASTPAPQPRPSVAPPQSWAFPLPQRAQLSNGIEVLLHHLPGQHVISATVVLDHSLSTEPAAHEGITSALISTLSEGTENYPGERFAEVLETYGAALAGDVGMSGTQLLLDVPATRFEQALQLLAEAIRRPSLTDTDTERQVDLWLAQLAQLRANASATAAIEFQRRIFASSSRESRSTGGEEAQASTLTGDLVRQWAPRVLAPQCATIVVGGDLDNPAAILAMVEQSFGDWENSSAVPTTHLPAAPGTTGLTLIDRPGSVQADLRLGGWSVDRFDPRWSALRVATYAMGGAFNSRLNTVLREEKGFTYGARLSFAPLRSGGTWAVSGSFRTEVMAEALGTALDLLSVESSPFSEAEVRDAQNYLTGAAPLQFATADGVVDQAALQLIMNLPDDYLTTASEQVLALVPNEVSEAYSSVVDLAQLTGVIVGDAEQLEPQLTAAGFDVDVVHHSDSE